MTSRGGRLGLNLFLVLTLFLVGCSAPDEQMIAEDFREIFSKEVGKNVQPIIISVGSGEGDSDNVYKHVRFDAVVGEDVSVRKGWLAGGEVILLYQKVSGLQWKNTWYDLKRKPSQ